MNVLLTIALPAKLENLERLMESVSKCARTQGFDQKKVNKIELAIEEVLVNIFNYSYPEKPGEVEINCKMENGRFIIEIIDSGIPFDMTSPRCCIEKVVECTFKPLPSGSLLC